LAGICRWEKDFKEEKKNKPKKREGISKKNEGEKKEKRGAPMKGEEWGNLRWTTYQ